MIFIYYPLILLSILGYGFFASKKLLNIQSRNLGHIGIVGIFLLLLYSYGTTQFFPHNKTFNLITLMVGLCFFIFLFKKFDFPKKDILILFTIMFFMIFFILVGKNHDDFHYYHFPYILSLIEYPHPIGLGNLNLGFNTHSSIFLLSSLLYLPGIDYNLFHLYPVYINIFANFILLKLVLKKEILNKYIFVTFLSLASLILINIFFYRLGEYGTDRSAMVLTVLLFVNVLFFINRHDVKINGNLLKLFLILFTIIISLKVFYITTAILLLPLILYVYQKNKSIKLFFNLTLILCFILFCFVIFTNFINSGCLLFPEQKTCFFDFRWSATQDTVEYLRIHFENWAKAGSGSNYQNLNKEDYIVNFNWLNNWFDKYFFNKVSDFLLSLIFVALIFLLLFKRSKITKKTKRTYLFLFFLLFIIFLIWFTTHPSLRYGGYHLIFLLVFVPLSMLLEDFSRNIKNLEKKITILVTIILIIFVGRNINRLVKEYKINSYNPMITTNFPVNDSSFRLSKAIKNYIVNRNVCKKQSDECKKNIPSIEYIHKNRFIIIKK